MKYGQLLTKFTNGQTRNPPLLPPAASSAGTRTGDCYHTQKIESPVAPDEDIPL